MKVLENLMRTKWAFKNNILIILKDYLRKLSFGNFNEGSRAGQTIQSLIKADRETSNIIEEILGISNTRVQGLPIRVQLKDFLSIIEEEHKIPDFDTLFNQFQPRTMQEIISRDMNPLNLKILSQFKYLQNLVFTKEQEVQYKKIFTNSQIVKQLDSSSSYKKFLVKSELYLEFLLKDSKLLPISAIFRLRSFSDNYSNTMKEIDLLIYIFNFKDD